jgi:DNA polymerase III epsilon subunit-like protein
MIDLPPILVVDVETTGLDTKRCGLVEIGAVWLTGQRENEEFDRKCRPWEGAVIEPGALEVNGCDWVLDPTVAPESVAIDAFLDWVGEGPVLMAGMNPRFDLEFLRAAFNRSWAEARMKSVKPEFPFPHRTIDLHTLAVTYAIANEASFTGKGLNTDHIMELLGLPVEPRPHRAIQGARCAAEALRILFGIPSLIREAMTGTSAE